MIRKVQDLSRSRKTKKGAQTPNKRGKKQEKEIIRERSYI